MKHTPFVTALFTAFAPCAQANDAVVGQATQLETYNGVSEARVRIAPSPSSFNIHA